MKIKQNPVLYIFTFYICISAYLIFAFFSFQQNLAGIRIVNLNPVAYGLLIFSSVFLALSVLSLLRIPIFHYLFKMVHLWLIILFSSILFLYFKYGYMLNDVVNASLPQKIAEIFPGTQAAIFKPLVDLTHDALLALSSRRVIILISVVTIVLAVIQIILYMPSSLRYVYYTHISPIKYTLKHIFISLLLFIPLLFVTNYLFKLDTNLNPKLENILNQKQQNVKDNENAFFTMLTLWMPDVPDRIAYGKSWLAAFKKTLPYFANHNTPVNSSEYASHPKLVLGGMSKEDQAAINQFYIQRLQNDNDKLDKEIANYILKYQQALQLARSFHKMNYQNPINYTDLNYTNFYSDYAGSFLSLLRLNLLEALIDHATDPGFLVKTISTNYFFNLIMIRNSKDPNVKLLYIEKQAVIAQFLYNLLNNPKFQNQNIYDLIDHLPILVKVVVDQKLIAKNKLQLLGNELAQANKKLSRAQSVTADFIKYTYKYNKTLNCIFGRAQNKYNLNDQDISDYIRQNAASTKASLNNVIGNIICKTSMPDNGDDIFIKSVETNGKIMILKARNKIFENKVNIVNVGSFLNNHSGKYYNPFSGRALKWNRDTHEIYFEYNNGKRTVKVNY